MRTLNMEMEREKIDEQAHAQEAEVAETHVNSLHSEADLPDHDDSAEDHHEEAHVDYSHFTKHQLADLIKELAKDDNYKKVDNVLREIKPHYDELRDKERAEALQKFIEIGRAHV